MLFEWTVFDITINTEEFLIFHKHKSAYDIRFIQFSHKS